VARPSGCQKTTGVGFLDVQKKRPTGTEPHHSNWARYYMALATSVLRLLDIPFAVSMYGDYNPPHSKECPINCGRRKRESCPKLLTTYGN
jgi:hypothetical protein